MSYTYDEAQVAIMWGPGVYNPTFWQCGGPTACGPPINVNRIKNIMTEYLQRAIRVGQSIGLSELLNRDSGEVTNG